MAGRRGGYQALLWAAAVNLALFGVFLAFATPGVPKIRQLLNKLRTLEHGAPTASRTYPAGLGIRFEMVLNTDKMSQFEDCEIYLYQAQTVGGKAPMGAIP